MVKQERDVERLREYEAVLRRRDAERAAEAAARLAMQARARERGG